MKFEVFFKMANTYLKFNFIYLLYVMDCQQILAKQYFRVGVLFCFLYSLYLLKSQNVGSLPIIDMSRSL